MARSDSELRTLLPCPLCGRSLTPIPMSTSVTFHCKNGHEFAPPDLLSAQSTGRKEGLDALLADWKRQHQALINLVEDARRNGYLDVAAIFHRSAETLLSRIGLLRQAQVDSSKLLRVPQSTRAR